MEREDGHARSSDLRRALLMMAGVGGGGGGWSDWFHLFSSAELLLLQPRALPQGGFDNLLMAICTHVSERASEWALSEDRMEFLGRRILLSMYNEVLVGVI